MKIWNIICIIIIILLTPNIYAIASSMSYSIDDGEITKFTQDIVAESTSVKDKTNSISNWIRDNTKDINDYENLALEIPTLPFVLLVNSSTWELGYCIRNTYNNDWIFASGCGRCAEYSYLFHRMSHSIGLETRIVKSLSRWNHAWNQVNDLDEWVNVEPRSEYNFSTEKYEREWKFRDDSNVSISYINAFDYEGNETQVTEMYTKTSKLVVKVTSTRGEPLHGVKIDIQQDGIYNVPCECITDREGLCEVILGDNIYTILIEEWYFWPLCISKDVVIPEDGGIIEVSLTYDYGILVLDLSLIILLFVYVLYLTFFMPFLFQK